MLTLRSARDHRPWRSPWRWILGLIVLGAIGLSIQYHYDTVWTLPLLPRITAGLSGLAHSVRTLWPLTNASEVEALRRALAEAQAAAVLAAEGHEELTRLRALLQLGGPVTDGSMAARVIRHDLAAPFKIVTIDRGRDHGVRHGMPVLAAAGLVGRVEQVATRHATVLLLIDPNHAVDVVDQRSRSRGILIGRGTGLTLGRPLGVSRLEYLEGASDMQPGDALVTSGLDGRYPSGLPVGQVRAVDRRADGLLDSAEVVPFIDWQAVELVRLLPVVTAH